MPNAAHDQQPSTEIAPEIGQLIDGHRILEFIGQGGMGWVYRVEHLASGQELALKLLRSQGAAGNLDRIRFEREFKLTAGLDHPGLVGVHSFGLQGDQPYYTMELVEGMNLRDYVGRKLRLLDQASFYEHFDQLCQQLLEVLFYIHSQGIIHRDLKPENILVDRRGWPRLLDFGLARAREVTQNVTVPGTILGTFTYMPPEQITSGEIDERSDLYSFGVMVYECLAGRPPFEGAVPAIFYQILDAEPPDLEQLTGPLPAGMTALVRRLLSKEPSHRPYSARQVLQLWRPIFSGLALPAEPGARPHTLQTPKLVGRQALVKLVGERLSALSEEPARGAFLAFEGVSGAGKSRMLQETAALARALDLPVERSLAHELENLPYQLWLAPLRAMLEQTPGGWCAEWDRFRSVLGLILPELGGTREFNELNPIHKHRLFDGMLTILGSRAQLILLEDLEHADEASLEFLHFLVRSQAAPGYLHKSLLIVAALNAEEPTPRTLVVLEQRELLQRIVLQPLSQIELGELLSSMLDGSPTDPESLARIYEETGGIPAFAVELTKLAFSEGRIRWEGGAWSLRWQSGPDSTSALPLGFRELLLRRFNDLTSAELEVARIAALLTPSVSFGRLEKVSRLTGLELLEHLSVLSRRKLIQEDGRGNYRFCSQLMAGVALQGMPAAQKSELHLRIAQTSSNPAELAYHYSQAGRPGEALGYWVEAGDSAVASAAYADGARFYTEALKLSGCSDSVQLSLADAYFQMGHLDEAQGRLVSLLEKAPASEGVEARANLLAKLGFVYERQGELRKAHDSLVEALALLGIPIEPKNWAARLRVLARVAGSQLVPARKAGKHAALRAAQPKSLELARLSELLMLRLARVLFFLHPPHWLLTSADITVRQHRLALADGRGEGFSHAQQMWGMMWLRSGRYARAQRHLRRSVEDAKQSQLTRFRALTLRDSGFCLFMAGDPEGGLAALQQSLQESESIADVHYLPQTLLMIALLHYISGRLDESERSVLPVIEKPELWASPADMLLCQIFLGLLRVAQGRLAEAEVHLSNAEFMEGRCPVFLFEAFLLLLKATLAGAPREQQDDPAQLEEALRLAREVQTMGKKVRVLTYYSLQGRALEAAVLVRQSELGGEVSAPASSAVTSLVQSARGLFPKLSEQAEQLALRLSALRNQPALPPASP